MAHIEIEQISTLSENGEGHWGVTLSPDANVAWQAPMMGDGGEAQDFDVLATLLARYDSGSDFAPDLDPTKGPDEILFRANGLVFLATISVD